jgi:hypothetical protein
MSKMVSSPPPTLSVKKILSRVTRGSKVRSFVSVNWHLFMTDQLLMDEPYLKSYLIKMTVTGGDFLIPEGENAPR